MASRISHKSFRNSRSRARTIVTRASGIAIDCQDEQNYRDDDEFDQREAPSGPALLPRWIAAKRSRAVEIARRVADQAGERRCSVRSAGEGVQHGLLAGPVQFEYRSTAERASTIARN
jgi:hypothetical protein